MDPECGHARGALPRTRTQTHTLDPLGMIPGVLGVLAAIAIAFGMELLTP